MLADVAIEVCEARAADRIGEDVIVLVEDADGTGRAMHQAPETDGVVTLDLPAAVGDIISARVTDSDGIDLIAEAK